MLVDIDGLKKLNDLHGMATGDVVLRAVIQFLTAGLREVDAITRFDGDSFALTLPAADLNHAVQVAERVRNAIGLCKLRVGEAKSTSQSAAAWSRPGRTTMGKCCFCGRAWPCRRPRRPAETEPFIMTARGASRSQSSDKNSNRPWPELPWIGPGPRLAVPGAACGVRRAP